MRSKILDCGTIAFRTNIVPSLALNQSEGSDCQECSFQTVKSFTSPHTYASQYMTPDQRLMFRYDNSGHHRNMSLPTYPHHKHDGREDNVVPASAPDLAQIIRQIEAMVQLP